MQVKSPNINQLKTDSISKELLSKIPNLENQDLQNKEISNLRSQLIDLEKKYQALQFSKDQQNNESKIKEDSLNQSKGLLQKELLECKKTNEEKNVELSKLKSEIALLQNAYDSKIVEILRMKNDADNLVSTNSSLMAENKTLITELEIANKFKASQQTELASINSKYMFLSESRKEDIEHITKMEYDYAILNATISDLNIEIKKLNSEKQLLYSELENEKNCRTNHQLEVERMLDQNSKLLEDQKIFNERVSELDSLNSIKDTKLVENESLINEKEEEIYNFKTELRIINQKYIDLEDQILKIKTDKNELETILEKNIKEIEELNKIRNELFTKVNEYELQIKDLENTIYEIEGKLKKTTTDSKNLENKYRKMSEEDYFKNQELNALREHIKVLENQNHQVI